MDIFFDLYVAARDHPEAVLICFGVPLVLAFVFRGNGDSGSGSWFDCDGDGGGD